jgi:outer membrane lipoprotein-sorting protein
MPVDALRVRRLRWLVPAGAAAVTAIAVLVPGAASGSDHPPLAPRTAAQLLADVQQAQLPAFSGTVVETARLGLPSLPGGFARGAAGQGGSNLVTLFGLLTGSHTVKISYAGPEQQRIAVLDQLSETDIVHNGIDLWTYASDGNQVTHTRLSDPQSHKDATEGGAHLPGPASTPAEAAQRALQAVDPTTVVTVDRTARVADRAAYQLELTPRDSRSLIQSVRIAVDSATHMPLRVQLWSRSAGSDPAFEVGFTDLSLSTPGASTFRFSVPPDAKVTEGAFSARMSGAHEKAGAATQPSGVAGGLSSSSTRTVGTGWLSVFEASGVQLDPQVSRTIDDISDPVAGGRLIHTTLLSVLLTDDGRILAGAVTPQVLEQIAAGGTGG